MENPWLEIKNNYATLKNKKNFILEEDCEIINEFNKKNSDEFKVQEYILPFPFLGNVSKPEVLILVNNPGFDQEELRKGYYKEFHTEILNSYTGDKPMYCFDEKYVTFSDYWYKKLGNLIKEFGENLISEKISILNYFPYSSTKFKDFTVKDKKSFLKNGYLKSQEYNFELVKNAMKSNAVIIVVRGRKNWFKAVEGLENYENMFKTNSYLNSSITENNCTGFYDKIGNKLKN